MLKFILLPFSLLYSFILTCRNWFYALGIFKSYQSAIFTINVGNLTVGGTGKTPHIEYLINLLADTYKTIVISRGYGRKTTGFVLADENASPETIGDEPFQYYSKFKDKVKIGVAEQRVVGVKSMIQKFINLEIILLDDAFQHRAIKPHLNIMLSDYHRPFYEDFVLPAGRLRESKNGAKRADAIVITKCPENLEINERFDITEKVHEYSQPNCPIFFSKIEYDSMISYQQSVINDEKTLNTKSQTLNTILISAIAQPNIFEDYMQDNYQIISHLVFKDHHDFSREDIEDIFFKMARKTNFMYVTTEKDMAKINSLLTEEERKNFYYLPMKIVFDHHNNFDEWILTKIKTKKSEE